MTILVINGPNLNLLGKRRNIYYGSLTLGQINKKIKRHADKLNVKVLFFQSNHEGKLIDYLQQQSIIASGIIINPGALTHYSYALYDALYDTNLPIVEVHLSNIKSREPWRRLSVIEPATVKQIIGKKDKGYIEALDYLVKNLNERK